MEHNLKVLLDLSINLPLNILIHCISICMNEFRDTQIKRVKVNSQTNILCYFLNKSLKRYTEIQF